MRRAFYHTTIYYSIICLILLQLSCRQAPAGKYSHPEYFDSIFLNADNLKAKDPAGARRYLDAAFRSFPRAGIEDWYRRYSFEVLALPEKNYKERLLYCDSALWVLRDHQHEDGFKREIAEAYFLKGSIFEDAGRSEDAFLCFNKGMQLAEELKDSCLKSRYTLMISEVNAIEGKNLEAARLGSKGLQQMGACSKDVDWYRRNIAWLNNTGIFYDRSGMPDSALWFYRAGLAFMEQHRSRYLDYASTVPYIKAYLGVFYGNIGSVYWSKGDLPQAEQFFRKSLEYTTDRGLNHGDAQFTWMKLARLYLHQNRMKDAGEMLNTVRFSLDTLPDPKKEMQFYQLEIDYWRKSGQTAAVASLMPAYFRLQDSLNKAMTEINLDAELQYRNFRNEHDLSVLQKERQIKDLTLLLVISFSAIAVFAVFFLWYNWRRSRQLNATIHEQNTRLRHTLEALEQSQANNLRLMSIVAHDLRNPIGAIASIAGVLAEEDTRPESDLELFRLMLHTCNSSFELINDLLQQKSLVNDMKTELLDIGALLHSCVDLMQYKAAEKELMLIIEARPLQVPGNLGRLWRVISNLITNAIKFSTAGGRIEVCLQQQPGSILISVQDEGIGIPAADQEHIFDMFTHTKRSGTLGEAAFGMGLAISKLIVEAHNGHIWFESREQQGTIFYVSLPKE